MPELPDLTVYIEHLQRRTVGQTLTALSPHSPFVLRTVAPSPDDVAGLVVAGWSRLAKQLVLALEDDHYIVFHLMIAGRLHWQDVDVAAKRRGRKGIAALVFTSGTLLFTEAGTKKRASIRIVRGNGALAALDPGGLDVGDCRFEDFEDRLRRCGHTLKRALTDQHVLAGIGNAYSDEILHAARLSPFKLAGRISEEECRRLFTACRFTLDRWTRLLRARSGTAFPSKVTAFHPEMAVHGRYRAPCPDCGSPVQRIVYAENEANYCAKCQTGGRLLADRALSRLLKDNWPKRLEELE
jgi:formamidopyrimidine-DNA glycosylase